MIVLGSSVMEPIAGLDFVEDFIGEDLEAELIGLLDVGARNPGTAGITHVQGFMALDACYSPVPEPVVSVIDLVEPHMGRPESVIASVYEVGASLAPHIDPELWSDTICVVSLQGPAELQFSSWVTGEKRRRVVKPRTLMVMSGESRYQWLHGIEMINEPRIVLVFRRRI